MNKLNRVLTVREVVATTGLSERTIRGLIATGRLPAIRPKGLRVVRIPETAIQRLMQERA